MFVGACSTGTLQVKSIKGIDAGGVGLATFLGWSSCGVAVAAGFFCFVRRFQIHFGRGRSGGTFAIRRRL
jgi:hypothetical protein